MDKTKMLKKSFIILILDIAICFSQDVLQRPSFPDVFQAEIEGTFKEENGVVEIDASMFYDRLKNRAALFILKENELTRQAYDFDNDESITIDGNDCDVEEIPDEQGFFPFTIDNGKKKMSPAEEAFFFTKSKLDMQSLTEVGIPTLVYRANVDIPQYGQKNCDVTHVFSKPDTELAICKEGLYCNSTLISLSVQCKNEQGGTIVDHVYRFSRFRYNIEDESVFLPPPGIHCEMKITQPMSPFPSYFSFTYDIIENPTDDETVSPAFKKHKEIWYDADYKIVRIDEFENDGLHFSSRLFDLNAEVAFTIVGSNPTCDIGLAPSDFKLDETTRLPKLFFAQNDTTAAVFVGKRKVHGLDYQVWSLMWTDSQSAARVVEEAYFLQINPNEDVVKASVQPYTQISHIDMHTYEMNEDSQQFELILLEHFSIYNYRTKPKEWSAFDVSSCFKKNQKKEFSIKIEKFPLVKGSQSYREVLEHFYDKIIAATKVSVIRISELRGIFDGVLLLEIRGSILDNSKSSGWPTNSKEPGMEKTFEAIKRAASEGKLSITFKGEGKKAQEIKVISVEALDDSPPDAKSSCFSGASMAAASLVLLLIGVSFGIVGYYVFLKKRKLSNTPVRMKELDS